MKPFLCWAMLLLALTGCANMSGGMPSVPFDAEADLGIAMTELKAQSSIKTYYTTPSITTRNQFISTRLVLTNIAYIKFIKEMSAEETQLHSAADLLVISLDVAAAAANPVNAKTIMSGLSSIIGGSRLALDKNTFHEKTMSALIASMNAQRKEVLSRILAGTSSGLEAYGIEQAVGDLNDYYLAGTFQGALNAIQKDAGSKEIRADEKISDLTVKRDKLFVSASTQSRVDKLLDAIKKLPPAAALTLSKAPPVSDAFTEKTVTATDSGGQRLSDAGVASQIVKMRVVLGQRDEKSLDAWEAAVKSVQP